MQHQEQGKKKQPKQWWRAKMHGRNRKGKGHQRRERMLREHSASFYFPSRCWVGFSRSAFHLGNSAINCGCWVWECNSSSPLCCWGSLWPELSGFPKHLVCGHANLVQVFQSLFQSPLLPRGIESFDLLTLPFTKWFKTSIEAVKDFLYASVIVWWGTKLVFI